MATICLDIGGTKIAGAIVKGKTVLNHKKMPTPKKSAAFLKALPPFIKAIAQKNKITAIKIGVAGLIDSEKGTVIDSPNLPGKDIPLRKFLKKYFRVPIKLENDTNCFALGEYHFGAGKPYLHMACLTLGTGVGAGLILNNQLYKGRGAASELGHSIIQYGGPKDSFGNPGSLEAYISKQGFARLSRKKFNTLLEAVEIENMAKKGNAKAKAIYKEIGQYLGIACANIANTLDVEAIIIGGGISHAGNLLLTPARSSMKGLLFVPKPPKLIHSKLENTALLGASML